MASTQPLLKLWSGHNRLKAHMYNTYKIGHTDLYSCREAAETAEHILQDCQNYRTLRQAIFSSPTELQAKLWGTLEEQSSYREQEEEEKEKSNVKVKIVTSICFTS
ncbi:hypothetical protein ElyMa_006060400 [Elysia marginata]|uniref:Reverse transcriptase zinc-binding domain-containing protein n=1 Tax=Elysia marginata TaxID=1093978 RepID=A0AAV4GQ55_9GAST|nr:hypothetical protein ElyMa_006060400 [Elysia marginata]